MSLRHLLPVLLALPTTTSVQAADVPKGDMVKFTFANSKVFPGTTRSVSVYIPRQYDGKTPACLWVNQDGVKFNAPEVFDKLIAEKAMPVTIGVFVTPGVVPAANPKALARFNRSFEYDGLGDAYARFVIDELLPEVEKHKASDGRAIMLSKNPNDRAISGSSSGAIAAFVVAWERPDSFRRVFSNVGTFVGLRGGNELATLVRKTEPKPLRVFLMDGSADLNIYGGDWWMANQEMERALTFAGYEVQHIWGTNGHGAKEATEKFPEAVRWLWKDYPTPIKAGLGSSQMKEILVPGQGWELVGEGYKFAEGPAVNAKGEVFFDDAPNSKIYRIGSDGKPVLWVADSKKALGQAFGPNGLLYSCSGTENCILAWDENGKSKAVTPAPPSGARGNDIVVRHDGSFFFTAPFDTPNNSRVFYVSPKGEPKAVDHGLKFANGITLSPDQTLLYVADSRTKWVYSYQIKPDGDLAFKQRYYHLHCPDDQDDSGADGMRTDHEGRLWVATKMGLQVCDQAGRVNCILPTPNGRCSNLTFGGPAFDTLYVTAGDKVYKRKVKVKGTNAYMAPFTPAKPRL